MIPGCFIPNIWVIGAGGVGSWLTPVLAKLLHGNVTHINVMDGDTLEEKNLDRQLFNSDDIGQNKAVALAKLYGVFGNAEWFSHGQFEMTPFDVIMVCVDNHTARKEALQQTDSTGGDCLCIIGANETNSAEAYVYRSQWKDGPLDPRIYYPEILTDTSDDPRAASIGCTGEAQVKTPQLVTANFMAAALMQQLFLVWAFEVYKVDKEAWVHLPHKLVSNLFKIESHKAGPPVLLGKTETVLTLDTTAKE